MMLTEAIARTALHSSQITAQKDHTKATVVVKAVRYHYVSKYKKPAAEDGSARQSRR